MKTDIYLVEGRYREVPGVQEEYSYIVLHVRDSDVWLEQHDYVQGYLQSISFVKDPRELQSDDWVITKIGEL